MSLIKRVRYQHLEAENLGKANVNPPAPVIQDNYEYSKFTVGTDQQFIAWDVPENHVPATDLIVEFEWTCDNATSNGKFVKPTLSYQSFAVGESMAGNHANSPRESEEAYVGGAAWLLQEAHITIPAADFADKHGIVLKLTFETPAGTALDGEPHLKGIALENMEYINR